MDVHDSILSKDTAVEIYLLPKLTGFPTWNDGDSSSVSNDSLLKKLSRFKTNIFCMKHLKTSSSDWRTN